MLIAKAEFPRHSPDLFVGANPREPRRETAACSRKSMLAVMPWKGT